MKNDLGWFWPDDEQHITQWMRNPKNRLVLNSRESYQGKKQVATLRHCRSFDVAVDIGAHVGLWSYNLAHVFDRVVAIEPVERHRECFTANVLDSPKVGAKVQLLPYALGAEAGRCTIESAPTSSGDSRVSWKGDDVEIRTLDSLELAAVDLVKIDCEGFEENVLRGAVQTLEEWRPTIVVEQKRDMATRFGLAPQGAVRFLEGLGYRVAEEIGGDFIMVPA